MEFNPSLYDLDYSWNFSGLKDVLIYYKDYFFESRRKDIELIEELIKNKKGDYYIYLKDYDIAKEMNKRTPIINYLYKSKYKNIMKEKEMNDMVKIWESLEKMIKNKNIGDIGSVKYYFDKNEDYGYLLNKYFNDNNNKIILNQIFNEDIIEYFKNNNNHIKFFNYNNLNEVLKYYKDYKFESKKNEILLIEKIIKNKDVDFEHFLQDDFYTAIKMNKKTPIINYIYNIKYNGIIKTENNYKNAIEILLRNEKLIQTKNIEKMRIEDCYILDRYFHEKNCKKILIEIFKEDEIEYFKKNNKINESHINELKEILNYYKYYKIESKNNEILLIEEIIKNKDGHYEKYLDNYETVVEMNYMGPLINDLYNELFKENIKKESIIHNCFMLLKLIKDKKFKKIRKREKNILNNYFDNNNNQEALLKIYNKDEIDYFLTNNVYYNKYSENKMKEILKYYKNYFFESKKEEIKKIEEIIQNKNRYYYLEDYNIAEEMNKKIPIINYLFDSKNTNNIKTEIEFNKTVNNYKEIELMIKNKKIEEISKKDKEILNKYFNNDNNKELLFNVFSEEEIEYFINETNKELLINNELDNNLIITSNVKEIEDEKLISKDKKYNK